MVFRILELTQGNIDNAHLYLAGIMDLFPVESVGGSSKRELGTLLEIHCGVMLPVLTDIAGDKKIFRKRSWLRHFFELHTMSAGNKVVIEKIGLNRYHVYPARA